MPEDVSFEFGSLRIRARRIHCSTLYVIRTMAAPKFDSAGASPATRTNLECQPDERTGLRGDEPRDFATPALGIVTRELGEGAFR
jgi:hypothetical protein